MVLLTSSQVGVALSSFIILLCTFALFLSGYVLQQKTVSDIRRAIKPQVAPFKYNAIPPPRLRDQELWEGKDAEIVVVKETPNGESGSTEEVDENMVGATRWQKAAKLREKEKLKKEAAQKALAEEEVKRKNKRERGVEETEFSRAARRKKIKDDIVASGGEGFKGYKRRMW